MRWGARVECVQCSRCPSAMNLAVDAEKPSHGAAGVCFLPWSFLGHLRQGPCPAVCAGFASVEEEHLDFESCLDLAHFKCLPLTLLPSSFILAWL